MSYDNYTSNILEMDYSLEKVSQIEFEERNAPILFGTLRTDKAFAIFSKENKVYRFSWKSELIDPIIKEWNEVNYLIGVDLDFIILNIETGEILNKFQFDSFFCNLQFYDEIFYIITQIEVFRLDSLTFKIIDSYPLPDIFDKVEVKDNYVIIVSFGGEKIFISRSYIR